MLIGELAKSSGLSRDTIRYYERRGLVTAPIRRRNTYKEYPDGTVVLLGFIKQLQAGGFTLSEVRGILDLSQAEAVTCGQVGSLVHNKLEEIDKKIEHLKDARGRLLDSFTACDAKTMEETCTPVRDMMLS